jgi:hypothetical protein
MKTKSLSYSLIKKKVPKFLEGNKAKTDTNRAKPTQQLNRATPTLSDDTSDTSNIHRPHKYKQGRTAPPNYLVSHRCRRGEVASAIGGEFSGRSHKSEETCLHKTMRQKWCPIQRQPTLRVTSLPTRHKAKHPQSCRTLGAADPTFHCSDMPYMVNHENHLPGPPP